jgi:hypothetical protein
MPAARQGRRPAADDPENVSMQNKLFSAAVLGLGVVGLAALAPAASAYPPTSVYRSYYGARPYWYRYGAPYGAYSYYGNRPYDYRRYYGPYSSYYGPYSRYYGGYRWPYDYGRSYYYGRPYSYSYGRPYYYRW